MVSDALKRLIRERKIREDDVAAEREAQRLQEVRAAFFEGMAAGYDQSWMERPPEDYWLESDARRLLYAGPPAPLDPSKRAVYRRRGYPYDPQRDPGHVIGKSFSPSPKSGRRGKRK